MSLGVPVSLSPYRSAVHSLQNSIDCLALSMGTRPRASCLKGEGLRVMGRWWGGHSLQRPSEGHVGWSLVPGLH